MVSGDRDGVLVVVEAVKLPRCKVEWWSEIRAPWCEQVSLGKLKSLSSTDRLVGGHGQFL